jgi:hypothetical protein
MIYEKQSKMGMSVDINSEDKAQSCISADVETTTTVKSKK